jgi:hypothetical protein
MNIIKIEKIKLNKIKDSLINYINSKIMVTKEEFESYCRKHNLRYENKINCYDNELNENFNGFIFIIVCCNGYFETVKWLSTLKKINIHADEEGTFRMSCREG